MLDTVASNSPGLVSYWAMDDSVYYRVCADSVVAVRDAGPAALNALLQGGAELVVSTLPMDSPATFSPDTPPDGSKLTVYVGERLAMSVRATDPNPTDTLRVLFELPGERTNPTGAFLRNLSAAGADVAWTPLPRDAGKAVRICFTLTNGMSNPRAPRLAGTALLQRLCVTLEVPLCRYKTQPGDTIHTIADGYGVDWRAIFAVNPDLASPDRIVPGTVRPAPLARPRPAVCTPRPNPSLLILHPHPFSPFIFSIP